MITDQKRTIRKSQGYDLGFFFKGTEYWINTSKWNEEKEKRFYKETGLKAFREEAGNKNLVFYDPEYFETKYASYLKFKDIDVEVVPQPFNMSCGYQMFHNCTNVTSLNLSGWDVFKVVNMYNMFAHCINLTNLNLSGWDVSNVKNAAHMFRNCKKLQQLDLDTWNSFNVKITYEMFRDCRSLKMLNLSNWDMSDVTDLTNMFRDCNKLVNLDLSNWNVSAVTNMQQMFTGCNSLISLNLKNWKLPGFCYEVPLCKEMQKIIEFKCAPLLWETFDDCKKLHKKYKTKDNEKLLRKIIEDNNRSTLNELQLF